MEVRYHFMPGQTPQNTRISELKTELHITGTEWKKIIQKLDKRDLQEEEMARQRVRRQKMKEENQAMIDSWDDSFLNICRRADKEREEKAKHKETDRIQRHLELRKEQEKEREKFVNDMRKAAYMETGFPKDLNSALLCSEVYFEREKQKEFAKMLNKRKEEEDKVYAEKVKREAEEELKEKEEEKKKLLEQKRYFREFYAKQIKEIEAKKEEEKRHKLEVEAIDNIKAVEDMERIEAIIKQREMEKRKANTEFILKNLKECEERKRIEKQDELDKDMLIAIQEAAKARLEVLKKQRKKELEQQVVARRIAIGSKVAAEAKEFADHERRIIEEAEAELNRKEEERLRADIEKAKRMKEERMKDYKRSMEEEERKKEIEAEVKRWEMMNSHKISEITKVHDEKIKREEWEKKVKYRELLKAQIAEKEELEKQERDRDLEWLKKKLCNVEEDEKFYKYAEEILNIAKSRGRSTYPIEKVIERYKKENDLVALTLCKKSSNVTIPDKPGKMAHDPCTDPNYNKCRNNVDSLYSDNK